MNDESGPKAALEVPDASQDQESHYRRVDDDGGELLLGVVEVGTGCEYAEALTEIVLSSRPTDLSLRQHWTSLVYHEPGCWPAAFAFPPDRVLC